MTDSPPPTLRALNGLPMTPPPLGESLVVVIDAQREYTDGLLPLDGIDDALGNIEQILDSARSQGTKIIHVAHVGTGTFAPGKGGLIIDRVAPQGDEEIVTKSFPNAFNGTTLRDLITAAGNPRLVICGFMTHMCVSATTRAALDAGLDATVIADACATRPLPSAVGGPTVPASTVHDVALTELADLFGIVSTTAQLLGA